MIGPTVGRRLIGRLLLVGVVVSSVSMVPHRLTQLRDTERSGRLPSINGVTSLAGVPPVATAFLAHVRAVVPSGASIELVVPVPPDTGPDHPHRFCGRTVSNGRYYWYLYQLLPRTVTCGRPDVILYLGVAPADSVVPVPAGATVREFAPGYVIAELAAGGR